MFFNLWDHWRLNSPSEVRLCFSYTFFFFLLFSLNRSAHLKKKKRSGHQSPLNKVFGLPSFGLEKRPVKKQELLYVINIFWTLKSCFLPLDGSEGSPRRLFPRSFSRLCVPKVFYKAVSRRPPYYSRDEMMVTGIPSSINSPCHRYFHIH